MKETSSGRGWRKGDWRVREWVGGVIGIVAPIIFQLPIKTTHCLVSGCRESYSFSKRFFRRGLELRESLLDG